MTFIIKFRLYSVYYTSKNGMAGGSDRQFTNNESIEYYSVSIYVPAIETFPIQKKNNYVQIFA